MIDYHEYEPQYRETVLVRWVDHGELIYYWCVRGHVDPKWKVPFIATDLLTDQTICENKGFLVALKEAAVEPKDVRGASQKKKNNTRLNHC
jgi:hypothetical protein